MDSLKVMMQKTVNPGAIDTDKNFTRRVWALVASAPSIVVSF